MDNVNAKSDKIEEWIDLLRAMAMFLVVFGHTYDRKPFYQFINPFKMSLFYFPAGIFAGLDKEFVDFVNGIAYRLVIP